MLENTLIDGRHGQFGHMPKRRAQFGNFRVNRGVHAFDEGQHVGIMQPVFGELVDKCHPINGDHGKSVG